MAFSMPTHFVHITDAPLVLGDGDFLVGHRFVMGGATLGRVLFTEHTAVEIRGRNVTVMGCEFERL